MPFSLIALVSKQLRSSRTYFMVVYDIASEICLAVELSSL